MKNILIVAAENSAETYAAQVVDQFLKNNKNVHFFGFGGDKLKERGVELLIHSKDLSVVGIIEVVSSIIKLKRAMNLLYNTALRRKADAVLLIDYPDFNLRLAKKFKKAGIRVYYYISPTVWAWRYSRVKTIKKYVDHMFIIFPFEIPIYQKEGISFTYTGHPLLPDINVSETRAAFRKRHSGSELGLQIALLPGSRKSEVNFLLPRMLEAAAILKQEFDFHLYLLKANNIEKEQIEEHLRNHPTELQIIDQEEGYNLIGASDLVLTTCGTSNLEIAVLGVPFTAVYQVNKLSYLLGRRFVKINLYSIVNILAGGEVIKELIQKEFTAVNMAAEMKRILTTPDVVAQMQHQFAAIRTTLRQPHHPPEIIYQKISTHLNTP